MSEHRWTIKREGQPHDYTETAVVDVENGYVVISYELLAQMLTDLGYYETSRCADPAHTSSSGVDQNFGPDKVWRCDECGRMKP